MDALSSLSSLMPSESPPVLTLESLSAPPPLPVGMGPRRSSIGMASGFQNTAGVNPTFPVVGGMGMTGAPVSNAVATEQAQRLRALQVQDPQLFILEIIIWFYLYDM